MKRFLLGFVLLAGSVQLPVTGTARAAAPAPAAGVNRVEPLSVPLRLTMTAEQALQVLGKPRSDHRAFGGGLTFPGLMLIFDATGREIGSVTINGEARLACGLGVCTPLAKIQEEFPGGNRVYDNYDVTVGQYALSFRISSGAVDRIVIRPAGRRFTDFAPSAPAARPAPAVAVGALAGQWIDPRNAQSFEIFGDGRYRTGVGGEGRVASTADGLAFSGALAAWDQGRATVSADRKVIEFLWTNADGSRSYFAFLRASP